MYAIKQLQDSLYQIRKNATATLKDEEPVAEIIDGVEVKILYEGSNRSTDYSTVLLDGFHFARECTYTPYSIFQQMTTTYVCFTDLSQQTLVDFLKEHGLTEVFDLMEEYYPPEDKEPAYNCCTKDFDAVLKLWKVWKAKYVDRINSEEAVKYHKQFENHAEENNR